MSEETKGAISLFLGLLIGCGLLLECGLSQETITQAWVGLVLVQLVRLEIKLDRLKRE